MAEPTDNLDGLADARSTLYLDYFSIPQVVSLCPALSKFDILRLCAVSGGIPKIMREYNANKVLKIIFGRCLIPRLLSLILCQSY